MDQSSPKVKKATKSRRQHLSPPHKRRKMLTAEGSPRFPASLPHSAISLKSEDVLRLMIQSMEGLGLKKSAQSLRDESNVCEETEQISTFKRNLLDGDWEFVLNSLSLLNIESSIDKDLLLWAIHRHIYLEYIETSDPVKALSTLRDKLMPLLESIHIHGDQDNNKDFQKAMKQLSSLLVLNDKKAMYEIANWPGIEHGARDQLLKEIHKYVSPSIMLPPGRLGTLLDQAIDAQRKNCLYHNPTANYSPNLLENHACKRNQIPLHHIACQPSHNDEVWCLEFSHNGEFLVSGSKDSSIIIWNSNPSQKEKLGTVFKTFSLDHGEGIHKLCWSADDRLILGCTTNQVILCTVETGEITPVLNGNSQTRRIQSIGWCPDEQSFICGGLGQYLTSYSLSGEEIRNWKIANVVDIDVHLPSNTAVAICQQGKINVIQFAGDIAHIIKEVSRISSVAISTDGEFVLVHLFSQEIHLWNLKTRKLVAQYYHKRSLEPVNVFLSATFAGQGDSFVLSGSLDGRIYMWQRNGALLEVINGHDKPINCIEWNKFTSEPLFASGGDDKQVVIWHTAKKEL